MAVLSVIVQVAMLWRCLGWHLHTNQEAKWIRWQNTSMQSLCWVVLMHKASSLMWMQGGLVLLVIPTPTDTACYIRRLQMVNGYTTYQWQLKVSVSSHSWWLILLFPCTQPPWNPLIQQIFPINKVSTTALFAPGEWWEGSDTSLINSHLEVRYRVEFQGNHILAKDQREAIDLGKSNGVSYGDTHADIESHHANMPRFIPIKWSLQYKGTVWSACGYTELH